MDTEFTNELLEMLLRSVRCGELKLRGEIADRVAVTDPEQRGLRARINTDGISFWVRFETGKPPAEAWREMAKMPMAIAPDSAETPDDWLKLGDFPKMTIESARRLAAAVRLLAGEGVDVKKDFANRFE